MGTINSYGAQSNNSSASPYSHFLQNANPFGCQASSENPSPISVNGKTKSLDKQSNTSLVRLGSPFAGSKVAKK